MLCTARVADTLASRLIGLLGERAFPSGQGLWLRPCSSIHTFFLRFPIDVVYLTEQLVVVKVVSYLLPFRGSMGGRGVHSALELPAGTAKQAGVDVGQSLTRAP